MDSINRNQPENNVKNLTGAEAAKKIKELAEQADTCFFTTSIRSGQPPHTCPMALLQIDDYGNFWFLSAKDSDKNADIVLDPKVQLLLQGSPHAGFLSVYGHASISTDKQKIHELWKPLAKVWFTEGENDPRITVIKVSPLQSHYWDNKHGSAIAFIKMAAGLLIGQTLDDSIEGDLAA